MAFLIRLLGKGQVFPVGLGLSGKCRLQVLFTFAHGFGPLLSVMNVFINPPGNPLPGKLTLRRALPHALSRRDSVRPCIIHQYKM